jgi:magnesium-transporting ATPase (P-type)
MKSISIFVKQFSERMRGLLPGLFSASKPPVDHTHNHKTTISNELLESARADVAAVLQKLRTETNGLTENEARARLRQYGPNEIAKEKRKNTPSSTMAKIIIVARISPVR